MKQIIFIGLLGLGNCLFANINAIVSILPQQTFLKAIGGDKVNITLMVKPGNSPHTYEPKPSQMKDISRADIYFSIGVEFEKVWLPKFINQSKKTSKKNQMIICDVSNNIAKTDDPHIWTSPNYVKIIAKNMFDKLIEIDKINKVYYEKNYNKFIAKINETDNKIKKILKTVLKGSKFMVFHPSWGYFANQYDLVQLAIEVEGKSPKPKTIRFIIEEARKENIKAIFTAPEFSTRIAKQIAKELNIKVIKISPLNPKWSKNLQNLANAIAND